MKKNCQILVIIISLTSIFFLLIMKPRFLTPIKKIFNYFAGIRLYKEPNLLSMINFFWFSISTIGITPNFI